MADHDYPVISDADVATLTTLVDDLASALPTPDVIAAACAEVWPLSPSRLRLLDAWCARWVSDPAAQTNWWQDYNRSLPAMAGQTSMWHHRLAGVVFADDDAHASRRQRRRHVSPEESERYVEGVRARIAALDAACHRQLLDTWRTELLSGEPVDVLAALDTARIECWRRLRIALYEDGVDDIAGLITGGALYGASTALDRALAHARTRGLTRRRPLREVVSPFISELAGVGERSPALSGFRHAHHGE